MKKEELKDLLFNLLNENDFLIQDVDIDDSNDRITITCTDKSSFTIVIRQKEFSQKSDIFYPSMEERLNLQSIGYYIKEGSNLVKPNQDDFVTRLERAESKLYVELRNIVNEEPIKVIETAIQNYISVKEEIQFSLGMKAGAKLALHLTTDFNNDI